MTGPSAVIFALKSLSILLAAEQAPTQLRQAVYQVHEHLQFWIAFFSSSYSFLDDSNLFLTYTWTTSFSYSKFLIWVSKLLRKASSLVDIFFEVSNTFSRKSIVWSNKMIQASFLTAGSFSFSIPASYRSLASLIAEFILSTVLLPIKLLSRSIYLKSK